MSQEKIYKNILLIKEKKERITNDELIKKLKQMQKELDDARNKLYHSYK